MVKVYPFRALHPTADEETLLHPDNPNRFAPREYDRSVYEKEFCRRSPDCPCMNCSKTPVVILSPGRAICKEFDIGLRNVKEFLDGGVLQQLVERSFLIYAQTHGEHTQVAICAALSVEDCVNGIIKKHENVIKETDGAGTPLKKRIKMTNMDPVMMMYQDNVLIDEIVSRIVSEVSPVATVESLAGESRVWAVTEEADIVAITVAFEQVEALYIADGHHRTAASCLYAEQQSRGRRRLPPHSKFLMAYLFPQSHLRVISFNRLVRTVAPLTNEQYMIEVGTRFNVVECAPFSTLHGLVLPTEGRNADGDSAGVSNSNDDCSSELTVGSGLAFDASSSASDCDANSIPVPSLGIPSSPKCRARCASRAVDNLVVAPLATLEYMGAVRTPSSPGKSRSRSGSAAPDFAKTESISTAASQSRPLHMAGANEYYGAGMSTNVCGSPTLQRSRSSSAAAPISGSGVSAAVCSPSEFSWSDCNYYSPDAITSLTAAVSTTSLCSPPLVTSRSISDLADLSECKSLTKEMVLPGDGNKLLSPSAFRVKVPDDLASEFTKDDEFCAAPQPTTYSIMSSQDCASSGQNILSPFAKDAGSETAFVKCPGNSSIFSHSPSSACSNLLPKPTRGRSSSQSSNTSGVSILTNGSSSYGVSTLSPSSSSAALSSMGTSATASSPSIPSQTLEALFTLYPPSPIGSSLVGARRRGMQVSDQHNADVSGNQQHHNGVSSISSSRTDTSSTLLESTRSSHNAGASVTADRRDVFEVQGGKDQDEGFVLAEDLPAEEIFAGSNDDMIMENVINAQLHDQLHMLMYFDGKWYELFPNDETLANILAVSDNPVDTLGVQILVTQLLSPILGIFNPSTDQRMIYVSGGDGIETVMSLVDCGTAKTAFCVHRVSVQDVIRIADAGLLLPPKATCFDPKPSIGLLVRLN